MVGVMTEFVIGLAHRPGSLAQLSAMLGAAGVNIDALAGWHANGEGVVRVVVDNPEAARAVLAEAGLRFDERAAITVTLPNRPGALGEICAELAAADVDIEAIYVLGGGPDALEVAICVDETATAAGLLTDASS
jgi:hypothetical protein